MLFTELRYLAFFIVAFGVYWALRSNTKRKVWLLCASYYFYGSWDWRFLSLIMLSTLIDYVLGARMAREDRPRQLRMLVIVSVVVNLTILGFFKYFNFFVGSFVDASAALGLHVHRVTLEVVLPVGVSFYTFQSLSYTIDIYRRQIKPAKSLLDFAVAVAFFPHLVAGPIMRARDYLHQLDTPKAWREVDVRWALILFIGGFFKKACISDNISPYVDQFYANPANFGVVDAWLATVMYATQIYCDFSGYTDMAIASAGMLGYRLADNFDAPYLSTTITDFWRRWHMSLSSWLRDYLYIPLGGNRAGRWSAHRNLMLTMLLGGLWHGASWNFLLWGGMHGGALVVHKEWTRWRTARGWRPMPPALGGLLTLVWVLLAWVPFRAPGFRASGAALTALAGGGVSSATLTGSAHASLALGAALAGAYALHLATYHGWVAEWWRRVPSRRFVMVYALAWTTALALKPVGYVPFIYFQF